MKCYNCNCRNRLYIGQRVRVDGIDSSSEYKNFHNRFSQHIYEAEHPYSDKEMRTIRDIPIIIPQSTNGKIVWNFQKIWDEPNPKTTKKHRRHK